MSCQGRKGGHKASDEGILCGVWSVSAGGSRVVSQDPGETPENGRGLCACHPNYGSHDNKERLGWVLMTTGILL